MEYGNEDDFGGLFKDLDLTSSKLGKTEIQKNELIFDVMICLNDIDFWYSVKIVDRFYFNFF